MEIPRFIYRDSDDALKKIITEGPTKDKILATPIISASFDDQNGILLNYEGAEFPQKGVAPPEAIWSANIVKAIFNEVFRLRPKIVTVLASFNRIGLKLLSSHFLKDEYRTAGTRELDNIVHDFILYLTSDETVASDFSKIFSHLIEYDNAYRLRVIDIASETSKEKLMKNPRSELKRLFKVVVEREIKFPTMESKYKNMLRVVLFFLYVPKFKRAFVKAVYMSDWSKMVYDDIDKYWACLRTDYDFMGMSYEDRQKLLLDNCFSIPIQREYQV